MALENGTKGFKWTIEIEVDESWVADGFDMDDERAKEMLAQNLPYAYNSELAAKVLKSPSKAAIMKVQGYAESEIKKAVAA